MNLTALDKRLLEIAEEIAARHPRGLLKISRLVNKIRLRTEIFNALRAEAARAAVSRGKD